MTERFMVVDKNRTPVITGMCSYMNAQQEAENLNKDGPPEFAPYRVVRDLVAEDA